MKKEIDKDGRILYKFSHSTAKGGNVYIHKTIAGKSIGNLLVSGSKGDVLKYY